MKQRTIWVSPYATILFVLAFLWQLAPATAAGDKPNVVLVMTDDQGYGDLACHGNPVIQTPNLDKLHTESVRLTNFHVGPTCSPTRAALLTGRYGNRTGVWHTIMGRSLLPGNEVTIAEVFGANGYRTGMFGKWHLGDNYPMRPHDQGFHEALTFGGGAIGNTPDYWGNDYFDDTYLRNGKPEKFQGYCTDVWFREAIKFIEANKERPFFCYLPTNAPHGPFLVADKYSKPYKDKGIESPLAEFYGMITNIDENMKRLMRKLDELGLRENTILIFMTDNGSTMGNRAFNAGMRGQKGSEYEGGHRVPFFIRWPKGGLGGGRDVDRLTAHIDVLPSLIEMCGLNKPQGVTFDGTSLVPLLTGKASRWPDRTLMTDSQRVDHPIKWRRSAVMTDRWRLINGKELYEIQQDTSQKEDVAPKQPDVVKRLRQAYDAWWADLSPSFTKYAHIALGAEESDPTWLTTHDIHGEVLWTHGQVERGQRADGFWAVEVAESGLYEISLRRWPPEVDRPISNSLTRSRMTSPGREPQMLTGVTEARLSVGGVDVTQPVPPDAAEVKFRVPLEAGEARLQAWFIHGLNNGATHGAYYVGVKRLSR